MKKQTSFLPMNREEMKKRGWEQADFVYISGDAYVDHPSFGAAIITRGRMIHIRSSFLWCGNHHQTAGKCRIQGRFYRPA